MTTSPHIVDVDVNVFTRPEGMRDPFPYYDALRPLGPVPGYVDWSPGTVPGIDPPLTAWAVFSYELVEEVLRNWQVYSSRDPGQEDSDAPNIILQGDDPPVHKIRRTLATKAFSARRVTGMKDWLAAEMVGVADRLGEGDIDVCADLTGELPTRSMVRLLGLPDVGYKKMLDWAHAFMQSADLTPEERRDRNIEMIQVITAKVDERRQALAAGADPTPADGSMPDFITALVTAEEDGEVLSPKVIVEFITTLIVAGNETSTFLGGHLLHVLAYDQKAQAVLRADRGRMDDFVDETMRMYGPVHRLFRWVRQDTELGGQQIKENEWVAIFFVAANRDPDRFPDPHTFDIDREDAGRNLSFGAGIHFCLGAALARLNLATMINSLLDNYSRIEPGEVPPTMRTVNIFNYAHAALPIRFVR
ncbi:MAG: cytochrome P450 [Sporichthyaceae bacterium]